MQPPTSPADLAQGPPKTRQGISKTMKWAFGVAVSFAIAAALLLSEVFLGVLGHLRRRIRHLFLYRFLEPLLDSADRWLDALIRVNQLLLYVFRQLDPRIRWAYPRLSRPGLHAVVRQAASVILERGRQHWTPARAPAFAFADRGPAARADDPRTSAEWSLRLASRLDFRRRRNSSAGEPAPPDDASQPTGQSTGAAADMHSALVVDRVAQDSLRAKHVEAPTDVEPELDATAVSNAQAQPAAQLEHASEASVTAHSIASVEAVSGSVDEQLRRARKEHYAFSLAALLLHPDADIMQEPSNLRQTLQRAVLEFLGDVTGLDVVLSGDTVWLILPGVLPKRARSIADDLSVTLADSAGEAAKIAVAGFPGDATTAKSLVQRCLHALAQGEKAADASRSARSRRERGRGMRSAPQRGSRRSPSRPRQPALPE